MKRYRCHKVVEAAKIVDVQCADEFADLDVDGVILELEDCDIKRGVTARWTVNRSPDGSAQSLIGGYLVIYDDGYESWSPAEAFEAGYTEITD